MKQSMIVDTNILVRLFVQDDDMQMEQIVRLIEQGNTILYVLSLVFIEAYWVLRKVYCFEKQEILQVFENFIGSDGVELEEESIMLQTLDAFRAVNVDFMDVYLAEKSKGLKMPVLTWNHKDFKKLNCEYFQPQQFTN